LRACRACGEQVERRYRFCPWCAAPLRRKLVEFFRGHAAIDPGHAIRVSRYLDEGHVRVSVWDESGEAQAAVSLDELEAARLGAFLGPLKRASLLEHLREAARR
jgi:predicted amidophosphoribosyltransferase